MKTTILKFFTLSAAIFAFSTISFGQNTATVDDVHVGARIIAPITLQLRNGGLMFGNIVRSSSAFTVTVNHEGTRSETGGVTYINTGDEYSAAMFSVTGESGQAYNIRLNATSISLSGSEGGTMTVDNFYIGETLYEGSDIERTINSEGTTDSFAIGAKLNGIANQTSGVYTGTFDVTVNYN